MTVLYVVGNCNLSHGQWCVGMRKALRKPPREPWRQKKKGYTFLESACATLHTKMRETSRRVVYSASGGWDEGVLVDRCPWCGASLGVQISMESYADSLEPGPHGYRP